MIDNKENMKSTNTKKTGKNNSNNKTKKMNKTLKIIIIIMIAIITIVLVGFIALSIYASDYYRADTNIINDEYKSNVIYENGYMKLDNDSNIGIIFYPGGKVEAEAYLPILNKLRYSGHNVYLATMPFNLAVFNVNAADNIINSNKDITTWYIAGHSLGGAMASNYASENKDKIKGLILLGSTLYGDYPLDQTLTVYGENDLLVKDDITYTENLYMIEGGNHAMFGNYGIQDGDGAALITNDVQQEIAVTIINRFINSFN